MMCVRTSLLILTIFAGALALPETVPEFSADESMRTEAEHAISLLQAQGMGSNACDDLAKSTIKEITDGVRAQQKVLDALDNGSKCASQGQTAVQALEKALRLAKEAADKATKAVSAATRTKVNFNSLSFESADKAKKSGKCQSFYDSNSYRAAKNSYDNAKKQKGNADAQVAATKKSLQDSKDAAVLARNKCACDSKAEMEKAWKAASNASERAANDKAYKKAKQMQCVISGTAQNRCNVGGTPQTKKPAFSNQAEGWCNTHSKKMQDEADERKAKDEAKKKLTCTVNTKSSNKAGVIKPSGKSGWSLTGCGMHNKYRSWNKLAGFEEMRPDGSHCRCDTGFGNGQLTCYSIYCQKGGKALTCQTKSKSFKGSGVADAKLSSGYTMTGGGSVNNYRSWNKQAGFEESRPTGNNWRADMGFGKGDFKSYVTGCKGLSCKTVSKRSAGGNVNCPSGYQVTGCGVNNHHRNWDKKSGFEDVRPSGNGCFCDTGFGTGDNTCYARCCKGT